MVRGRDLRATEVYKAATARLSNRIFQIGAREVPPPWLKAMEKIPPSEILTRPLPIQHHQPNPRARKPRNIFKPQQIVYEEDKLRREFFKDHPWELARPRRILEIDGKDSWACDWSQGLQQEGVPLSGESVVQRQLWLMRNIPGMSKQQAYDQARREFYDLRQEEDVERRIAREEAMMVGAYFGKTRLQIGVELEDREFEKWKVWAAAEIKRKDADRAAAYTSFGSHSANVDEDAAVLAELEGLNKPEGKEDATV